MAHITRILAPVDFSEPSDQAFEYARGLAEKLGAELHVIHAYELPVYVLPEAARHPGVTPKEAVMAGARAELEAFRERVGGAIVVHLREGSPASCIVATAEEVSADLIVMGTHGRTGLKHLLLGSVAERVVRTSPVPVVTVPWKKG